MSDLPVMGTCALPSTGPADSHGLTQHCPDCCVGCSPLAFAMIAILQGPNARSAKGLKNCLKAPVVFCHCISLSMQCKQHHQENDV